MNKSTKRKFNVVLRFLIGTLFVMLISAASISISSNQTINQIKKDQQTINNYKNVNDLIINIDSIKEGIQNQTRAYSALTILGYILAALIVVFLIFYLFLDKKDKSQIEYLLPRWLQPTHLEIIVPVIIGIFVAISVNFLASMDQNELFREQVLVNSVVQTIDSKQPDVIRGIFLMSILYPIMVSI